MYELTVERVFSAAHAIMIHGSQEPVHGLGLVTRGPIVAGDEEVARNPRARSAKLRVAERLA